MPNHDGAVTNCRMAVRVGPLPDLLGHESAVGCRRALAARLESTHNPTGDRWQPRPLAGPLVAASDSRVTSGRPPPRASPERRSHVRRRASTTGTAGPRLNCPRWGSATWSPEPSPVPGSHSTGCLERGWPLTCRSSSDRSAGGGSLEPRQNRFQHGRQLTRDLIDLGRRGVGREVFEVLRCSDQLGVVLHRARSLSEVAESLTVQGIWPEKPRDRQERVLVQLAEHAPGRLRRAETKQLGEAFRDVGALTGRAQTCDLPAFRRAHRADDLPPPSSTGRPRTVDPGRIRVDHEARRHPGGLAPTVTRSCSRPTSPSWGGAADGSASRRARRWCRRCEPWPANS